jgi:hypothetical protein
VFFGKMRSTALAVCALKLLSFLTVTQWVSANLSVKEMIEMGEDRGPIFHANAGGFILVISNFPTFPINEKSIITITIAAQQPSITPLTMSTIALIGPTSAHGIFLGQQVTKPL